MFIWFIRLGDTGINQHNRRVPILTRGTFLAMQVTTPPIESPLTLTLSIASIIFCAYSGSGHLTMLLSICKISKTKIKFSNCSLRLSSNVRVGKGGNQRPALWLQLRNQLHLQEAQLDALWKQTPRSASKYSSIIRCWRIILLRERASNFALLQWK